MIKFEKVKRFEGDETIHLPERKTAGAAGYDFEVAEDTLVPSADDLLARLAYAAGSVFSSEPITLDEMAARTKSVKAKPTLVPTGVKCIMPKDAYLQLSVRSSCPLKYWLILGNGVGIIDSDYASNPDNDGEIFFQIINLSPYPIMLPKGSIIGQGVIIPYLKTDDDKCDAQRLGGFGSTSLDKNV